MEPFEVMISRVAGADARHRPARAAGRRAGGLPALGPARRGHRPGHGRRRHHRDRGRPGRGRRPRPGARELARIPAAALTSDAIVHQRAAQPPTHRRAAPAPGAPDRGRRAGCRSGAWIPGAVLQALLGHPTSPSRAGSRAVRRDRGRGHASAGLERGAAVLRVKGTPQGARHGHRRQRARRAARPVAGAALAVAECTRNVAITGARPLGVTNCLNYGDPERPEAFWQLRRASAASATRAGRWACRSRAATSASTTSRPPAAHRADTCRSASSGCSTTSTSVVGPAFARRGDIVACWATPCPAWAARSTPSSPGGARRPARRRSTWRARPPCWRCCATARRAGLLRSAQDVSGGGLAVALAEMCLWGGRRRGPAELGVGAARRRVELFGESPGAGRGDRRAEPRLVAARGPRRPSTACRCDAWARPAATGCASGSSARAPRAPPRSAARASRTTSTSRSPCCATPGSTGCRAPSARTGSPSDRCGGR